MTSNNVVPIDLAAIPTPEHITLLLKCHKSTVLLSVLPETPLPHVKEMLLTALRARGITALPGTTVNLPENVDDVEFGLLRDKRDTSKGWVLLEAKEQETTDTKGGKRKAAGKKSILNETPAGVGFSDGSLIAYRIKNDRGKTNEEDMESSVDIDDPGWDVVFPTYDDEDEDEDDEG